MYKLCKNTDRLKWPLSLMKASVIPPPTTRAGTREERTRSCTHSHTDEIWLLNVSSFAVLRWLLSPQPLCQRRRRLTAFLRAPVNNKTDGSDTMRHGRSWKMAEQDGRSDFLQRWMSHKRSLPRGKAISERLQHRAAVLHCIHKQARTHTCTHTRTHIAHT